MRRLIVICTLIFLCILIAGLCQTALDPADFSGEWYASDDQSAYLLQDGLIYCSKHPVALSDSDFISGAYTYSKNKIYLFAEGITGLESGRELYLVHSGEGSFLCENKDGTGKIYFIRYNK